MVQERSELLTFVPDCCLTYAVQRIWHVISQHCVRDMFCRTAFPLINPLPSAASAVSCTFWALFGSFAGNMGLSDCLHPFIAGS
jgi:hypothetical protein